MGYEKLSDQQKAHQQGTDDLNGATAAAAAASAAELKRSQDNFDSGIVMLTNLVASKAKAVEQRIAEHLKGTKRFLQVELSAQVEAAADMMDILEGKRQKIADNYLSFKAYAVAAADKVEDYVSKGQGRGMSSIG